MIITLLGMSGIGKTYWAKHLEQSGFDRFSADDYIEANLGQELEALGYSGINDVSKWMGQPYDTRYGQTSQTYLNFEKQVMREVLSKLTRYSGTRDLVIDTTGSVIYMPPAILNQLHKNTSMVYFHIPKTAHIKMAELYLRDPKPVIWGSSFNQKENEANLDSIARCYPKLLSDRTKKYQQLAQITFDYDELHSNSMTAKEIVNRSRKVLNV